MRVVDRVTIGRYQFGVDWGRPRRLLAQSGDDTDPSAQLFIVPSHAGYNSARGVGPTLVRTSLILLTRRDELRWEWLAEGRVSPRVLAENAVRIGTALGSPEAAATLSLKKTVYVEEGP